MRHLKAAALVLAFALPAYLASADDKPNPTGTWTWSPTFAGEERRLDMILNLKLEGDKLTGDLNWGRKKTPIEEGTYKDGELSFKVSSERTGQKVTIQYTGKITGNTIKGKVEWVTGGGEQRPRNWEALRADADGKVKLSKVAKLPEKKANKGDEKPTEDQLKPEDFLGKWVGKWDEKFQVRFTITQDPKTKQLSVLYEFEQRLGKPLREERLTAKLEGNTLRIGRGIDLTISPSYPDKGNAVGRFVDRRLTADMVRQRKLYPVPDQESQRKALAAIKETLKGEYARAKTPPEREALAKNLLKYGGETKDEPMTALSSFSRPVTRRATLPPLPRP